MVLVVRVVRGEENIERKYKLIIVGQIADVADVDSTYLSEVSGQMCDDRFGCI